MVDQFGLLIAVFLRLYAMSARTSETFYLTARLARIDSVALQLSIFSGSAVSYGAVFEEWKD